MRGIALQTVIVIVVMLVIAGGVAGVLLSRGGEVISDLEGQDVSSSEISDAVECGSAGRALDGIRPGSALITALSVTTENTEYWVAATGTCTINGLKSGTANYPRFTAATCNALFGGDYSAGTTANAETCTIS
jgi:hypothetical protein